MSFTAKKGTILFVIDSFEYGGVSTYVSNQMRLTNELGFNQTVIGLNGVIKNPRTIFPDGNVIVVRSSFNWKNSLQKILFGHSYNWFNYLLSLKKYFTDIKDKNLDNNVIIHFSTYRSFLFTIFLPQTWNKRKISTFHGSMYKEYLSRSGVTFKSSLVSLYLYVCQFVMLLVSEKIVVLSSYSSELIRTHFSKLLLNKTILISGCIHTKNMGKTSNRSRALSILNIGRIEPRKGIDILISSLGILKKNNINFNAKIVSPVSYLRWFNVYLDLYEKENLLDRLQFIHAADEDQKNYLFANTDVFVVPSIDLETFCLAILEAISRGIPVIGANSGAIPEILLKIDKRLIFQSGSSKALAKTLIWFKNLSKKEKVALSNKSVQVFKKYYSGVYQKQSTLTLYS